MGRLLIVLLSILSVADAAGAQSIEWWAAAGGAVAGGAGTLTSSYSPPLLLDGEFTSHGAQSLTVDTSLGMAFAGGVDVFLTPRAGLRIMFDRANYDVTGTNGPYGFALDFTTHQPPDDRPQAIAVRQTVPRPDTAGSLTQLAIAFDAIVRIGATNRVNVTLSGGPHVSRLSGTLRPLAYTAWELGGHATLFEDDYELAVHVAPSYGVGFNAGVELNTPVTRRTAFIAALRYFHRGGATTLGTPSAILNADRLLFAQPLDEVVLRIGALPVSASVSGARVLAGLKVIP